jgi:CDGSH-type Zn-finger protein
MAKIITEDHNGHLRTIVELEPGEQVSLCRCWKSSKFPICDGTHKTLEGNVGSVRVRAPAAPPPSEKAGE